MEEEADVLLWKREDVPVSRGARGLVEKKREELPDLAKEKLAEASS